MGVLPFCDLCEKHLSLDNIRKITLTKNWWGEMDDQYELCKRCYKIMKENIKNLMANFNAGARTNERKDTIEATRPVRQMGRPYIPPEDDN